MTSLPQLTDLFKPQELEDILPPSYQNEVPVSRQCSKGWSARCARAKGPRCKCQCGGHNHGNPKADKTRNHEHGTGPERATLPWNGDVVCQRTGDFGCRFNIPQAIVLHSPTGMEWGYGGSGPADLALNILYWFTEDREFAERHYQDFKWEHIATLPREGGTIPGATVRAWIADRRPQTRE